MASCKKCSINTAFRRWCYTLRNRTRFFVRLLFSRTNYYLIINFIVPVSNKQSINRWHTQSTIIESIPRRYVCRDRERTTSQSFMTHQVWKLNIHSKWHTCWQSVNNFQATCEMFQRCFTSSQIHTTHKSHIYKRSCFCPTINHRNCYYKFSRVVTQLEKKFQI